jgi:hypothetical protein
MGEVTPLFLFSQTLGDDWRRSTKLGQAVGLAQSVKCLTVCLNSKYGKEVNGIDNSGIDESFIASFRLLNNLEILSIDEDTRPSPLDAKIHTIVVNEILKNGCRLRCIDCSGDPRGLEKFSVADIVRY